LFRVYLEIGPSRSLAETARRAGKVYSRVSKASYEWQWKERAEAWEAYKVSAASDAEVEALREMRRRHVRLSHTMQHLGGDVLGALLEKVGDEPEKAHKLGVSPSEARKLAAEGLKLERLIAGEPDRIERHEVDVRVLTEAQLEALARGEELEQVVEAQPPRALPAPAGEIIDAEVEEPGE
jgi:tRNA U34 5-carboxymethylaminomethyl modifying enzyme MnmG/GidA